MADVRFTGTSDFERVKKDYDELARKTAKVEQENRKLRQTSENQGKSFRTARNEQQGLLVSATGAIKNMVAGYVGLEGAIRLTTEAIREQRALQNESLDVKVREAAADASIVLNLSGESSAVKKQTIDEIGRISQTAGIDSALPVKTAFSEAISKASGDKELAMDATRNAALLQRFDPANIATFAAGGVSLASLLKSRDTREAFGFMLDVQARSPVSDPSELIAELPGAIAAIAGSDVRGEGAAVSLEAGALFAALGQATKQKAAPTSTASIQLASQLAKFFESREDDPGGLAERIRAVQESQALQAELLPGLTGEAKFLPVFKQLLRGDDSIATREFQKNVTGDSALSISTANFDAAERELSKTGVTSSIQLAAKVAADNAETERIRRENVRGAEASRFRDLTQQRLRDSASGSLVAGTLIPDYMRRKSLEMVASMMAETPLGPDVVSAAALQTRENQLRVNPFLNMLETGNPFKTGTISSLLGNVLPQSADVQEKVGALRETRERIATESMSGQELERQTGLLQTMVDTLQDLRRSLSPGRQQSATRLRPTSPPPPV